MASGVAESHGVIAGRSKAIEVYHHFGIRHHRIRRDEGAQVVAVQVVEVAAALDRNMQAVDGEILLLKNGYGHYAISR